LDNKSQPDLSSPFNRNTTLNTSSQVYTFDNHRSRSDIDVTFANEAACVWVTYEWKVTFCDLSDHNIITVEVNPDPSRTVEILVRFHNGDIPM